MKLTILKLATFTLLTTFLFSCSPNDEAYYKANIDDAKEKIESCNKDIESAITDGDEDEVEALVKDPECAAAHTAYRKYKAEQRQAEREMKRLKKEAEAKKAKEQVVAEFGDSDWKDYFKAYNSSDCVTSFGVGSRDPKCQAMKELLKTKRAEAKKDISRDDYEVLIGKEKEYCKADRRQNSACNVWSEVLREKSTAIVESYVNDYESLKKDFNQCFEKRKSLLAEKNWKGANRVGSSYPCDLALKAARKLKIKYNYNGTLD